MKLPVPVNIITGALGVGKTTALAHLLRHAKPPGEKWAVLVNEFGSLGIDAALLEAAMEDADLDDAPADAEAATTPAPEAAPTAANTSSPAPNANTRQPTSTPEPAPAASFSPVSGLVVRELAGGCLCCSLSGPLGVAVAQLVRTAKPDRLLIEPSGLGHPAGLLDTLGSEHLRSALSVRAVLCLVDVRDAAAEALAAGAGAGEAPDAGAAPMPPSPLSSETYQDQINVCDVLVGSKADLASPEQLAAFERWAQELYPPKAQVVLTSRGRLDPSLLDLPRAPVFRTLFNPLAHSRRRAQQQQRQQLSHLQQQPLSPQRHATGEANGSGAPAAGAVSSTPPVLQPRQPMRLVSQPKPQSNALSEPKPQPQATCGWLFSSEDVFDRQRLAALLQGLWPHVARLKGIFRLGKSSYAVPYRHADGHVELQAVSYRRESRLEIIVDVGGQGKAMAAQEGQGHQRQEGQGERGQEIEQEERQGQLACEDGQTGAGAGGELAAEQRLAEAAAAADWGYIEAVLLSTLR